MTRLAVRIEGYLLFLNRNFDFHTQQGNSEKGHLNGAYQEATVRGLDCPLSVLSEALTAQKRLRELIDGRVFKLIARWIKMSKRDGKMLQACMLHSNLAYLYRNVEFEDLNPRVVFTSLASQIFIFNHYKYDLDLTKSDRKKTRADSEEAVRNELGIPQIELFSCSTRSNKTGTRS